MELRQVNIFESKVSPSMKHLLLMPLLEFNQLLLVLHVHGGHDISLFSQHLP